MSWYELGLYTDAYIDDCELRKAEFEDNWRRFRIQWADFRNVNRGKKGKIVKGSDLIKLSEDTERVPKYHEIDLDAMKKRFGSKIKRKRRGK